MTQKNPIPPMGFDLHPGGLAGHRLVDDQVDIGLVLAEHARPSPAAAREAFGAGIHRTYVSDIERGARNPTIAIIEKLATTLA